MKALDAVCVQERDSRLIDADAWWDRVRNWYMLWRKFAEWYVVPWYSITVLEILRAPVLRGPKNRNERTYFRFS